MEGKQNKDDKSQTPPMEDLSRKRVVVEALLSCMPKAKGTCLRPFARNEARGDTRVSKRVTACTCVLDLLDEADEAGGGSKWSIFDGWCTEVVGFATEKKGSWKKAREYIRVCGSMGSDYRRVCESGGSQKTGTK